MKSMQNEMDRRKKVAGNSVLFDSQSINVLPPYYFSKLYMKVKHQYPNRYKLLTKQGHVTELLSRVFTKCLKKMDAVEVLSTSLLTSVSA